MHHWTINGGGCRVLSIVHAYTPQAGRLHVGMNFGSGKEKEIMRQLILEHVEGWQQRAISRDYSSRNHLEIF
jgi:hypothetical protein